MAYTLYAAFPTDCFVSLIYSLELLLRCLLHIFPKSVYFIRMVFYGHLTVCLLHLLVCCVRSDFKNPIVAVVAWSELGED